MYDTLWVTIFLGIAAIWIAMELTAFVLETFFHFKRFPTLSTLLVRWFGVKPLVIVTIIIASVLAAHWQWVYDNLDRTFQLWRGVR